jgi:DNA-binding response OmpR family regulator
MKKRILIIDDDRWFAESLGQSLNKHFKIALATTAEAAFPAIEKFRPEVIILDLVLGDKNAVTFLNEFISYDDLQNLQIIILSSVAKDLDPVDLRQLGATAILDKSEATPETIRMALTGHPSQKELK